MTEAQRAYETKRAAKAGMSLDRWLADKDRREKAEAAEAAKAAEPLERIAVSHGDAADIDVIVEMLKAIASKHELIVGDIGSTVGTHGGPGIVGLSWIRS